MPQASSFMRRRGLTITLAVLAAVLALAAMLAAAFDAGYFRATLVRYLGTHLGRPIQVGGLLRVQLLSRHPRVIAEQVTIGNPPWMPAGTTAKIGRVLLVFEFPQIGRPMVIESLEMEDAALYLARDSTGHANWQRIDPDKGAGPGLPLIRSLSMPNALAVRRYRVRTERQGLRQSLTVADRR
jgi:uncharacterized protein involved in outer membrane biogenesis